MNGDSADNCESWLEWEDNEPKLKEQSFTLVKNNIKTPILKKQCTVLCDSDSDVDNKATVTSEEERNQNTKDLTLQFNDLKIKHRQCAVIESSDESSDCDDEIEENQSDTQSEANSFSSVVRAPNFIHRLDWKTWCKKKARQEQLLRQKKEQDAKNMAKLDELRKPNDIEATKRKAWVKWCLKKEEMEQKKKNQEKAERELEEQKQKERQKKAHENFRAWCKFKQTKVEKLTSTETATVEQKVQKNHPKKKGHDGGMTWDIWFEKRKHEVLPKSPRPSWENPLPWQGPEENFSEA